MSRPSLPTSVAACAGSGPMIACACPRGALTARRQSLGIAVLRQLFRRCCHPLATQETKGAFALGLRLMAVDSTLDEVPDTPANALHFGGVTQRRGGGGGPQGGGVWWCRGGEACHHRCRAGS